MAVNRDKEDEVFEPSLVDDPTAEREWEELTASEFLKGYADDDAIYEGLG